MNAVHDITAAIRLLTVLPVGRRDGDRAARFFTAVGWLYAALALGIASGAVFIGRADGMSSLLVAALIVAAWALLSGFLHLDGLADSADGFGVRGDAERRLAVMRDSSIGAFGVAAIVLVVVIQVCAAAVIVDSGSWWALAAAPIIGRLGAALALLFRAPARPDGLAVRFGGRAGVTDVALLAIPLVPLFAIPPALWAPRLAAVAAGAVVAVAVPGFFARRFGGITGDVLGATVVLTETFVLVVGALAGGPL